MCARDSATPPLCVINLLELGTIAQSQGKGQNGLKHLPERPANKLQSYGKLHAFCFDLPSANYNGLHKENMTQIYVFKSVMSGYYISSHVSCAPHRKPG
jgi:hypothetical protein